MVDMRDDGEIADLFEVGHDADMRWIWWGVNMIARGGVCS